MAIKNCIMDRKNQVLPLFKGLMLPMWYQYIPANESAVMYIKGDLNPSGIHVYIFLGYSFPYGNCSQLLFL